MKKTKFGKTASWLKNMLKGPSKPLQVAFVEDPKNKRKLLIFKNDQQAEEVNAECEIFESPWDEIMFDGKKRHCLIIEYTAGEKKEVGPVPPEEDEDKKEEGKPGNPKSDEDSEGEGEPTDSEIQQAKKDALKEEEKKIEPKKIEPIKKPMKRHETENVVNTAKPMTLKAPMSRKNLNICQCKACLVKKEN